MYSEQLLGVDITPPFFQEIIHACDAQRIYLAEHPTETDTYFPLPDDLSSRLHAAHRMYVESRMPQISYVGGVALEVGKPLRPSDNNLKVTVRANEIGHLIESLYRQSVEMWILANRFKAESIASVGAEVQSLRKANLAGALWNAFVNSTHEAQRLPDRLDPNYRLKMRKT